MRVRCLVAMVSALAATLVVPAAAGQSGKWTPPRTPDGKPDLSGFWQGPLMRNFFESVGGPPFTPAGKAAYDYNMTQSINPEGLCLPAGIPRASISGVPFEIIQNTQRVAFLYELMNVWRSVPINGGVHTGILDPYYFGNGAAKWDGDTLVVDVADLNDDPEHPTWFDSTGNYHSDALHVVERWTRTGPDTMLYRATMEDPKVFSRPWTIEVLLYRHQEKNFRIMEYECQMFKEKLVREGKGNNLRVVENN